MRMGMRVKTPDLARERPDRLLLGVTLIDQILPTPDISQVQKFPKSETPGQGRQR